MSALASCLTRSATARGAVLLGRRPLNRHDGLTECSHEQVVVNLNALAAHLDLRVVSHKPALAIFNGELAELACADKRTSAVRCFILSREWLVAVL